MYGTTLNDQIDVIGAVVLTSPNPMQPDGGSIPFGCADPVTGQSEFPIHTFAQLIQLLIQGAQMKIQLLMKANDLEALILAATSVKQISMITWS